MATKAAGIVGTIEDNIVAFERRDHLRAFRQNLILGWLMRGNQQMELLEAISVYITNIYFDVEHEPAADRVVTVIQEALTDPHFNGFDLVNAVHTLREERRLRLLATKAHGIVGTIEENIVAFERRDHLRAFS